VSKTKRKEPKESKQLEKSELKMKGGKKNGY